MGLPAKTREELRKELATKIHGQPTDQDITTLEKELIAIAAPSALGGGNHGHAGIIVKPMNLDATALSSQNNQTLRIINYSHLKQFVCIDN
jgi:hypothetical protein